MTILGTPGSGAASPRGSQSGQMSPGALAVAQLEASARAAAAEASVERRVSAAAVVGPGTSCFRTTVQSLTSHRQPAH